MYKKQRKLAKDCMKQAIFTHSVHAIQKDWPLPSMLPPTSLPSSFPPHGLYDWKMLLHNFPSVFAHMMVPRGRKLEKLIFHFGSCTQ